jgi:hypothetical protein
MKRLRLLNSAPKGLNDQPRKVMTLRNMYIPNLEAELLQGRPFYKNNTIFRTFLLRQIFPDRLATIRKESGAISRRQASSEW